MLPSFNPLDNPGEEQPIQVSIQDDDDLIVHVPSTYPPSPPPRFGSPIYTSSATEDPPSSRSVNSSSSSGPSTRLNASQSSNHPPTIFMTKPTELERTNRYFGLPTCPPYITGTVALSDINHNTHWMSRRALYPIPDSHHLVGFWRGPTGPLILDLLRVEGHGVTVVDLVRIGTAVEESVPTLWIGFQRDSITISQGQILLAKVVDLLRQSGIDDLEVEFRESAVVRTGLSLLDVRTLPPSLASKFTSPMSSGLGIEIHPADQPTWCGTGCVYMKDGTADDVYLLTANHVVTGKEVGAELLEHRVGDTTGRQIDLLNDDRLSQRRAQLQTIVNRAQEQVDQIEADMEAMELYAPQMAAQEKLRLIGLQLSLQQGLDHLARFAELATQRRIGQIHGFPTRTVCSFGDRRSMRDWALIRVDSQRVVGQCLNVLDLTYIDDRIFLDVPETALNDSLLPLQGVVPQATIESHGMEVIMRGATAGLSRGISSPVASMIFEKSTGIWESVWPILGYNGKPFSYGGDSGAAVLDLQGNVGGMVIAGAKRDGDGRLGVDVTYASPMEDVLFSIENTGMLKHPQIIIPDPAEVAIPRWRLDPGE